MIKIGLLIFAAKTRRREDAKERNSYVSTDIKISETLRLSVFAAHKTKTIADA